MKKRNSSISTKQRNLSLRQTVDCKFYLQRLYFSVTHKALPIICVTFEVVYLCNNLLSKVIELLGSHFNRENYIEPVVYCSNCQKFGHISTNCFNKHLWILCEKSFIATTLFTRIFTYELYNTRTPIYIMGVRDITGVHRLPLKF